VSSGSANARQGRGRRLGESPNWRDVIGGGQLVVSRERAREAAQDRALLAAEAARG